MSSIKLYLDKTAAVSARSKVENVADDLKLHSLNTFLDALKEGLDDSESACPAATAQFDSMINSMLSAIARKIRESDSSGRLFSIDISSTTDPSSNKLTWTFDFHADLRKVPNP